MAISVTGLTVHTQNGGGTWQNYGSGGGSASTTATFLSGTSAQGRKFTGAKGFAYQVNASGTDLSNSIILVRFLVNGGLGATLVAGGGSIRLEDTSGNTSDWYVAGSDTYNGGWFEAVIDTANAESANSGTAATLTAIQYVGILVNAAASSGGDPNVYVDEVLSMPNTGLTLGGNTTNLFKELADWDDTSLYGVISRRAGIIFSKSPLILAPDASNHASTDEVIVFEEPIYNDGTNVDSALTLQGISSTDADTTAFTRAVAICENNGDIVGTNADKKLDLGSATDIDADSSTFKGFNGTVTTLNSSNFIWDGTTFLNCDAIEPVGNPSLKNTFFRGSSVAADGSALVWNFNTDPDGELDGAFFSKGTNAHHAMTLGTNCPLTITLRNWEVSGFNASDGQNDSAFYTADRGSDVTWTINIVGGTGNFKVKKGRAGDTVNIVIDPVTTTITVTDTSGNILTNARVYMTAADGTGPQPYQDSVTITRSTTTATVSHTAHGLSTGNKVLLEGITDKIEDNGVQTITVTGANTYTYTTTDSGSTSYTGTITATGVIFEELTDGTGKVSDTRTFTSSQPVTGWVRKSSSSPYYRQAGISATISNTAGLTQTIQLISDE
jgi:hypothetical protein